MTVWLGIVLIFMFLLLLFLIAFVLYLMYWMTLVAEASGISVSMFKRQRFKRKERELKEQKNAEFTQMLEELSQKHSLSKSQDTFADPLDELDLVEEAINNRKETDPDSLLTLLEFGLPDEEFEEALSAVEKDI